MCGVIETAVQRVREANRRLGLAELDSFEELLEAVHEQRGPIARQAKALETIAGRNRRLFRQFELPVGDFDSVGAMEEDDWLFVRLQLLLLRAAREMTTSA